MVDTISELINIKKEIEDLNNTDIDNREIDISINESEDSRIFDINQ